MLAARMLRCACDAAVPGARRRPRSTAHLLEIGNIPAGMQPHHVHSIIQLQTGFQDEDFTVQYVCQALGALALH